MVHKYSKIRLEKNPQEGEYYRLRLSHPSKIASVAAAVSSFLMLPVRMMQFISGHLLSHLVINPLFRKHDQRIIVLTPNKKYPDRGFTTKDEMVVVDILPERLLVGRTIIGWQQGLKILWGQAFPASRDRQAPETVAHPNARVQLLLEEIHTLIVEKKFKPEQIHLRGLNRLKHKQREAFLDRISEQYGHQFRDNRLKYNFYTLNTTHGDELDSVEVSGPTAAQQPIGERTFIIDCLPNSMGYTSCLKQYRYYANQLDTTVIGFNYRGAGKSKGLIASQYDMRQDAMAQVERLLAMGAKPANIGLMGECLGANVATHVAAECHKNNIKVKLLNVRSFRSLWWLIIAAFLPEKNAKWYNPLTWLKAIVTGLVVIVLTPLLYFSGWDLSIEDAFKSIPVADRDFVVVRSKKNKQGTRNRDDAVITHDYASLYSVVKEEQQRIKQKAALGILLTQEECGWLADKRGEHKFHVDKIQRHDAAKVDGHGCQLRYLTQTKGKDPAICPDAREYAIGFFRRTWRDKSNVSHPAIDPVVAP
jgi:hypothetical protein